MFKNGTFFNLWHCIQLQHVKVVVRRHSLLHKDIWAYNVIMHEGTPDVHLRGVTFKFHVDTRIFRNPYSDDSDEHDHMCVHGMWPHR